MGPDERDLRYLHVVKPLDEVIRDAPVAPASSDPTWELPTRDLRDDPNWVRAGELLAAEEAARRAPVADDFQTEYFGLWLVRVPGRRFRRLGWRIAVRANGGRFEAQAWTLPQVVQGISDAIDFRLPVQR